MPTWNGVDINFNGVNSAIANANQNLSNVSTVFDRISSNIGKEQQQALDNSRADALLQINKNEEDRKQINFNDEQKLLADKRKASLVYSDIESKSLDKNGNLDINTFKLRMKEAKDLAVKNNAYTDINILNNTLSEGLNNLVGTAENQQKIQKTLMLDKMPELINAFYKANPNGSYDSLTKFLSSKQVPSDMITSTVSSLSSGKNIDATLRNLNAQYALDSINIKARQQELNRINSNEQALKKVPNGMAEWIAKNVVIDDKGVPRNKKNNSLITMDVLGEVEKRLLIKYGGNSDAYDKLTYGNQRLTNSLLMANADLQAKREIAGLSKDSKDNVTISNNHKKVDEFIKKGDIGSSILNRKQGVNSELYNYVDKIKSLDGDNTNVEQALELLKSTGIITQDIFGDDYSYNVNSQLMKDFLVNGKNSKLYTEYLHPSNKNVNNTDNTLYDEPKNLKNLNSYDSPSGINFGGKNALTLPDNKNTNKDLDILRKQGIKEDKSKRGWTVDGIRVIKSGNDYIIKRPNEGYKTATFEELPSKIQERILQLSK